MSEQDKAPWVLTPRGITWTSVAANVALSAAKLIVGLACGSRALLADALHSGSDLFTDLAVLAGLRVSSKPADGCHPYGHRRVSTLVALFVGGALVGAAGWIIYGALETIHDLTHGVSPPLAAGAPFWVALASAPAKELMYRLTRHVGQRADDVSLVANAWHHRTDALTSLAAAAGLAGVVLGGEAWHFLDPLTAAILATFLVVVGVRIASGAAAELIDRAPAEQVLRSIQQAVTRTRGVRGYHAVRARRIGGKVDMDIHVQVDPMLTVQQGHEIAAAVRRHVRQAHRDVLEVIVHIEPAEPGQ